jgi:hypothetical protein
MENLEALGDWSLAKAQPGKIILGELGGIETGVRQLIRSRPLESEEIEVRDIDDYYADVNRRPEAVATQLVRQLADPRPRDAEVTTQLASYKALERHWHEWATVKAVLADLAERMTR